MVRRYGRHWFKKDSLISEFSDHFGIAVTRQRSSVALHAAKAEAELASKAKSEFIANMSHELRTPLNAVIGFSEMLRSKAADDPERVKEYAGYINEAAEHLLALISSILDVSRIQAGKLQVDRSHIDPDPIVRSCLRWSREFLGDLRTRRRSGRWHWRPPSGRETRRGAGL